MKKSLAHLPLNKKQELKRLRSIILEKVPHAQFIILFGSHARGDWVDDEYTEDHITYSYKSDFDILVITDDKKLALMKAYGRRLKANIPVFFPVVVPRWMILSAITYMK